MADRYHDSRRTGRLWLVDFTTLTPGALASLPGGLVLTRADASTVATVQTGDSTVVSGIAANVARAGRLASADPVGLLVEEARTNDCMQSNVSAWAGGAGATVSTVATAPDGGNAGRVADADAAQTGYAIFTYNKAATAVPYVESCWSADFSGSAGIQFGPNMNAVAGAPRRTRPASAWARLSTAGTSVATGSVNATVIPAANAVTSLGAADFWGFQAEAGGFATSLITTAGAAATRAADRLRHPTPAGWLMDGGRLAVELRYRPLYASTAGITGASFGLDASNFAQAASGVFTASVGGVSGLASVTTSWAANNPIDLYVAMGAGPTEVAVRVNGGAVSRATDATIRAALPYTSLDLLNLVGALQTSAFIETGATYSRGKRPTWAL